MSIPRERLQQQTQQTARATLAGARQAGVDAEVQADALQDRALEAQAEQAALLEASPLESQYSAAFAAQVEAKHDQAERRPSSRACLLCPRPVPSGNSRCSSSKPPCSACTDG